MDIAGIVLGAVGLAGPTYGLYKSCSKLISEIGKGESDLSLYSDKITVQKGLYTDVWRAALSLLNIKEDLATVMLEDEKHQVWTDPDFLKLMTTTLGEHFTAGMKLTKTTLEEIQSVLSKVRSEKEDEDSSSFKRSKATADKRLRMLGWGFKWKKDLLRLLKRLRDENWDLQHICKQREEVKRASNTITQEDKRRSDQDPMLARLFAIRDVSNILYDSLEEMSSCSCHCIYIQLRCNTTSGCKLEGKSDTKFVLPMRPNSRSQPAVLESIQFPVIITNIRKRESPIEQVAQHDWNIHIIIESKLAAKETNRRIVPLKRLVSIALNPSNEERPEKKKKIRFADNQTIITSSSWAIVTTSEAVGTKESLPEVVSLEPELGEGEEGEALSSVSELGLGKSREGGLVTPMRDKLQQPIPVQEKVPVKYGAGESSKTTTLPLGLEKPMSRAQSPTKPESEKASSSNPKGKGKGKEVLGPASEPEEPEEVATTESESKQPRPVPEKVPTRDEMGESSKITAPPSKYQKPKPKAEGPIARITKSKVWKSLTQASNLPKQDPLELEILTPDTPKAKAQEPSTTKPITVNPEDKEANVTDVEEAENQRPSTTKPSTTKPIAVKSEDQLEESNISNVKGADIVTAESDNLETTAQPPDTPKLAPLKSHLTKPNTQEIDPKKPEVQEANTGTLTKETQAADLKSKKAAHPQTPEPAGILKEKLGQILKPKSIGEPVVVPGVSSGSQPPSADDSKIAHLERSESPLSHRPADSIPQPPSITEIKSFCSLMKLDNLVPKGKMDDCIGQIRSCDMEHSHFLYLDQMSTEHNPLSLEEILESNALPPDDCLRISLTLAESLLEFGSYPSSFFQTGWRSCDIFFFPQLDNPETPNSDMFSKPYIILNSLKPQSNYKSRSSLSVRPTRSEHLFSLALTLVEIGYGEPLWQINSPFKLPEMPPQTQSPIAEYLKAKDILDLKKRELELRMGPEFFQVVTRCLFGDFGINEHDICKKKLQEAYYKQVVIPLKNCLERHFAPVDQS